VIRSPWVVLPLLAVASAAESPKQLEVRVAQSPPRLFAQRGTAITYYVEGPKASRLREVRFPLAPLLEGKSAPDREFVLLAFSNGRYWPIPWQREGDALRARVTPGLSYVVATALDEHLRRSLAVVCRLRRAWSVAAQRAVVPKICTQILCASEPFYASALAVEFGPGTFDPGSLTGWLGGWRQIPRDLCAACTGGLGGPNLEPPTLECVTVGEPGGSCSQGSLLLQDEFDADTPGAPPAASPPGAPPDDAVAATGSVHVVSPAPWGGKAVRIERSTQQTRLDGILGDGAASSGSYCLHFRGEAEAAESSISIALLDAQGRRAWGLTIGPSGSHVSSGSVGGPLDLSAGAGSHQFRFETDLDLGRFDVFVDGTLKGSGLELSDADFAAPERIRFEYVPMIVEGFAGACLIDDLVVRRTH
jgi:hypothetical protein